MHGRQQYYGKGGQQITININEGEISVSDSECEFASRKDIPQEVETKKSDPDGGNQ